MIVFASADLFVYAHFIVILVFVMSMIALFIVILVFVMVLMMLMSVMTIIVLTRKPPITFRTDINSNIVDLRFCSNHRFGCPNFMRGCHRCGGREDSVEISVCAAIGVCAYCSIEQGRRAYHLVVACYLDCFCKDLRFCIGNALRRNGQRRGCCRSFRRIIFLTLFQLRRTFLKDDPILVEYQYFLKASLYQLFCYWKTATVCCTGTCGRKEITEACTSMGLNRRIIECINSTRKISMACFTNMS